MDIQKNHMSSYEGKWGAMLAMGLGVFMGSLDMSIVNVSLPTLVEQLNAKFATVQWVILGYVLVITATMLGAARLSDMVEKRMLYNWGVLIFTLGSLFCGLSPNIKYLIAFRMLQGCGGVIMQAIGAVIIVEAFPPYERGRALGIMGSTVSIGISLGPAVGGLLIGLIGWRWVFLVKVPIGIIALFASFQFLRKMPPRQINQSFDIFGALILLITLSCFALGMTVGQNQSFSHSLVRQLLGISVVGILFFIIIESKVKDPMVDFSLFRNLLFSINLLMSFLAFITLSGVFLMPFFLQFVKHYSPQQIGLLMMVTPTSMGIIAPLSGMLSDRFGTRVIGLIGILGIGAGCLSISTLNPDVGVFGYLLRTMPLGMGLGIFQSPNNSAIMGAAPPERLGVASGLLALSRSLGQTTGIPIMGAIFTAVLISSANLSTLTDITTVPAQALVSGLTSTYRLGAIVIFTSTVLAVMVFLFERKRNALGMDVKVGKPA